MMDEWACTELKLLEGKGYGDFKIYKHECGPTVSYSTGPPKLIGGYQVRKASLHSPDKGKLIKSFANLQEAIVFSGHLYTIELKPEIKR